MNKQNPENTDLILSTTSAIDFAKAVRILIEELGKDKTEGSYYHSWKANIAMAFYDEVKRFRVKNKSQSISLKALHDLSNNAAENFLNLLIDARYSCKYMV